ncbi:MAG: hypothetical protein K2X99_00535 [Gemmatimonadaceae bacterium]|nr:hypothetical protein [Gemmatimonadaceae bacterium]
MRGNGGGNTPRRLIGLLQGSRGGRSLDVEKSTLSSDRLGFLAGLRSSGADDRFVGGLVILADHRCGSACEDFVAPFTDTPHALVVGDTTWGSTGQPKFLDLKNGMQFQVSARRYRRANGLPFEGAGLPPHIVVPLTASDLRAGKDATLERALAEIRAGRAPRAPH